MSTQHLLYQDGQVVTGGGTIIKNCVNPSVNQALGAAAGTGATFAGTHGTWGGRFFITTGSSPAAGNLLTVVRSPAPGSQTGIGISPANGTTAGVMNNVYVSQSADGGTLTFSCVAALAASTTYLFAYTLGLN